LQEGGLLTSIEKARGDIKRFEENSTKFGTFQAQIGRGGGDGCGLKVACLPV
jgi:hypothetical protein